MSRYIKKFTAKQRQDYHNDMSKIGAVDSNGYFVSDFKRGVHHEKANEIFIKRKRKALEFKKSKKSYDKYGGFDVL